MKVLLIASNIAESPYAVYPFGLSIIANSLTKDNHDVKQYDFLKNGKDLNNLKEEVVSFKPDLVGISIRNIDNVNLMHEQKYLNIVSDIVSTVRSAYNGKIMLGGAGFSLLPEKIIDLTGADYGIVGEGEEEVRRFANKIMAGNFPKEKVIYSVSDKNNAIYPALYNKDILDFYLQHGNMAPVQSKRGCLNNCIYCTYPFLEGRKIRSRSHESVIRDIKVLTEEFGAKMIFFTDSVFNDKEGNYLGLLNEMKRQKVNVPWTGFITPGGLKESEVQLMKDTGLIAVELGADAATDTTLKRMGKSFTFKDISETCDLFDNFGISSALYYMMGGPGETKETVFEGIENIKSIKKAASFIFMGIRILPNTPLERLARKEKFLKKNEDLLDSIYYISPEIDKEWLEHTLTEGFKNERNCLFPPDSHESLLKTIHKLGYSGLMLNKFIGKRTRKKHD